MRGTSNGNNRGGRAHPPPRPANSMEQDSFDSFEEDESELMQQGMQGLRLGVPANGLGGSNGSVNSGHSGGLGGVGGGGNQLNADDDELPKSVIVTNVDLGVFDTQEGKANFEAMFREFEPSALFHYLRSFRRIRVDFDSHLSASKAKISMDNTPVGDSIIHCYFIQVLSPCSSEDAYLRAPPPEKQFLISPPCSPPVGWEQPREDRPVVDYDLLTAMAQLSPGEPHELHPTKQINFLGKSVSTPSIVVHIAEEAEEEIAEARSRGLPTINAPMGAGGNFYIDDDDGGDNITGRTRRIRATRCPDRQSSLD